MSDIEEISMEQNAINVIDRYRGCLGTLNCNYECEKCVWEHSLKEVLEALSIAELNLYEVVAKQKEKKNG